MIWFLLDAFNLEVRKKNKFNFKNLSKSDLKYFIILIVVSVFFFIATTIIPIIYDVYWIGSVSFVIYIAVFIYFLKKVNKEQEKEYEKIIIKYKKDLDNLVYLLREEVFQLYTEKQIIRLIEDCNQILPTLRMSKSVFKPFVTFFTAILFPLVTLVLNMVMDKYYYDISVQVMIWIIFGSLYLLSLYYLITPAIGDFIDSHYNKLRKLRDMLSDIILLHFSNK